MRRPMVVANWKMNTLASDAYILATTIRNAVADIEGVEVVLCPPVVWLSEVADIVKKDGKVNVGAQNMFYEEEGPYTGEISPLMIRDIAKYVILGHSERRIYFHEDDVLVNDKVVAALKHNLSPIICVGEKSKSAPISDASDQLFEAVLGVKKNDYKNLIVAYEPVWAIGSTETAPLEHSVKAITKLKEIVGYETPMLYGGSVKADNIELFAKTQQIDGLLVGGASLKAADFIKICKSWSAAKSFKY